MPRIARLLLSALALSALPAAGRAQTAAPAAPVLERRTVPARVEPDPWLISFAGLSGRTARSNLAQLDLALAPYGSAYTRLPADDRTRVRRAFDDLLPGRRINRDPLTEPQARAIAYLALGPREHRDRNADCYGRRRRGGSSRCDAAIDSMSRHAAWIHAAALSLGRATNRRPRAQELNDLRAMNLHARDMVVGAAGCGCPGAREDAELLLASTRDAVDAYEASSMPAWMSLGDQRVQRMARLSDSLERTFLRCLGEG